MANIITRNANTITVNRFIVGKARTALITLATDHNAKIDIDRNKHYKVTLETAGIAKDFATALARIFREHNVTMPEPKKAKGDAPKTEKPHWQKGLDDLAPTYKGNHKTANHEASAFLRSCGLEPAGEAWDYWKSIR